MRIEDLEPWAQDFDTFCGRFDGLFKRTEPRAQAQRYLRGLMLPVERKNGWQLAEAVGDRLPDPTQRLMYHAVWDADAARDELQRFVVDEFNHPRGIAVLDESGIVKQGDKSVGVQRQYCGASGKVDNCQMGVFLNYWTPRAQLLVDRALYLPKSWCDDRARCRAAKVPEEVGFQTKPSLGLAMLRRLKASGLLVDWVTADEAYGDCTALRQAIDEELGWRYVLAVSNSTPVWTARPAVEPPGAKQHGRPRTLPRVAADAEPFVTVKQLVASWPAERWQRLTVTDGEKGPIVYDWARQRVVERRDELPGAELWLVARRSVSDPTELAYYLANAAAEVSLLTLAKVACQRFSIEQCFHEAKGEVGLDQYEVRYWHSWHRHITLSMMALAFLVWIRAREVPSGKRGPCALPS